jgi:hypothetical protein
MDKPMQLGVEARCRAIYSLFSINSNPQVGLQSNYRALRMEAQIKQPAAKCRLDMTISRAQLSCMAQLRSCCFYHGSEHRMCQCKEEDAANYSEAILHYRT